MMLDELRDGGEARPFEAVLTLPEKRETSFKWLNFYSKLCQNLKRHAYGCWLVVVYVRLRTEWWSVASARQKTPTGRTPQVYHDSPSPGNLPVAVVTPELLCGGWHRDTTLALLGGAPMSESHRRTAAGQKAHTCTHSELKLTLLTKTFGKMFLCFTGCFVNWCSYVSTDTEVEEPSMVLGDRIIPAREWRRVSKREVLSFALS